MNQRGFINIVIIGAIVIVFVVTGYFVLIKKSELIVKPPITTIPTTSDMAISTTSSVVSPRSSALGEIGSQVKYQIFQPGLSNKEILNSVYLLKNDILPKEVKFDNFLFSVKKVEIAKSPIRGFNAYVIISFNDQEHKIGFWHPDDPTKNDYLKTNACSKGEKTYDYVCGGVLAITVKEWNREPTITEKAQGIISVYSQTRIFLQELDYDFRTDNWNYVKISLGLHEEKLTPPTIN